MYNSLVIFSVFRSSSHSSLLSYDWALAWSRASLLRLNVEPPKRTSTALYVLFKEASWSKAAVNILHLMVYGFSGRNPPFCCWGVRDHADRDKALEPDIEAKDELISKIWCFREWYTLHKYSGFILVILRHWNCNTVYWRNRIFAWQSTQDNEIVKFHDLNKSSSWGLRMFMAALVLCIWILLAWNALGPRCYSGRTCSNNGDWRRLTGVECINVSYSWHCDLRNQHILQWGLSLTAINLAQEIWPRIPEKCVLNWTRAVATVLFSWADTATVAGACVVCTICSLWSVVDSIIVWINLSELDVRV
jgi:hypothetical protein